MSHNEDVAESVEKLQALIDAEFTASEATALKDIVVWWVRIRGAIALGGALGGLAKWVLLMGAFIVALKTGLLEFLFSEVSK